MFDAKEHVMPCAARGLRGLAMLLLTLLLAPALATESAEAMLLRADAYRLASESMRVDTRIEVFKNGQPDKERLYTVFARPGRQSLVLMRSPAEKGQKILMKGDDFWLFMPSSQRPIRITPTQKLLGDAAAGDLATLAWSSDYSASVLGAAQCEGRPCTHLALKAKFTSVTYARIELWLDSTTAQPLRADLYVQSDKLAKRARYETDLLNGRPMVVRVIIDDQIFTQRRTVMHFLTQTAAKSPDEWFNPMFLVRSEVQP